MTQRKTSRLANWRLALLFVVLLASLLVVARLLHKQEPTDIRVVHASYADLIQTRQTTGTVYPVNEFQARANFPGIVVKLDAVLGQQVKAGQMLVEMKDPWATSRVATATANLKSAELGDQNIQHGGSTEELIALAGDLAHAREAQAKAQHALDALKQLQARGAASAAEVDSAQQQLDAANTTLQTLTKRSTGRYSEADRSSAAARVADSRAALAAAKIEYANANIASPIAGTVYSVAVRQYDFVPMGADLMNVANLNKVQIRAFFDEPEMGNLAVGQPVRILWDGKPNREWHGHIRQAPVAAMVMGPRSVGEVTIDADDANGELLPNITVTVIVTTQRAAHVLSIPREALHTQGNQHFVFRVINDRLVRTPVQIGIVNLSRAEIRSGITPQDTIALNGVTRYELTDKLPVRIAQ
jgi:HlyD family secretion protein